MRVFSLIAQWSFIRFHQPLCFAQLFLEQFYAYLQLLKFSTSLVEFLSFEILQRVAGVFLHHAGGVFLYIILLQVIIVFQRQFLYQVGKVFCFQRQTSHSCYSNFY